MTFTRTPTLAMPVSLADAKAHLRVGHDDEDALITRYLLAAAREIEHAAALALTRQTISLIALHDEVIALPVGPLAPDAHVTVNGLDTLHVITGGRWPMMGFAPHLTGPVAITYEAGFGDTFESVPEDLQLAVMEQAAFTFDHRADPDARPGLVPAAARILARYRRVAL